MNPEGVLLVILASRLTSLQVDLFLDRVVRGCSLRDLAVEYGVSRSAVDQATERAYRKMRPVVLAADA